ncbi:MAG: hypothetical protein ACSHWP_00215 [Pseudoalteromonas sp.]
MILRTLSCLTIIACSLVHAEQVMGEGCALLEKDETKVKKIAILKAQADWVRLNQGITVSGKESILITENTNEERFEQEITIKITGKMNTFRVIDTETVNIADDVYLCLKVLQNINISK